ncbi:OsmC family peroxiredoxin [Maribellus comscasis]|uniref:OsmC family peroxiredoxin n=1 Tax=Maribellus comscasis TaxID=2681766 RepID=A0A6I6JR83_9BACT|nr:OsmC family protein [Maribellus comscasis]QGY45515.1 OsmC family peroxiredoxin [Maribellus comscasis]
MAISKIKVSASMGAGFSTQVNCSHPFVIDQPKMAGGNDEGPNPLEIFLSSLPACICAIGRIIATQRRINLRGIEVEVEGDIDKDFLLGKTTEGRAGFTEIRSFVHIDADMTKEEKEAFLNDVAVRCPIADNIAQNSVIKPVVVENSMV